MGFVLSYILFCYVVELSLRSLFVSNESSKGVDPDGTGYGEKLGEEE